MSIQDRGSCGSKANLSPLKAKAILSLHEDRIVLNKAEQRRVTVLNHLDSGALMNSEAAQLLGISVRGAPGSTVVFLKELIEAADIE